MREKFNDLEEELEREAVEDENLPEGVERMLQGMIRLCRQMMAGAPKNSHYENEFHRFKDLKANNDFPAAADKEAEFWSKMKQLEVLPDLTQIVFNFKSFTTLDEKLCKIIHGVTK